MNHTRRHYVRTIFRNRVLEANAGQYEDLLCTVLEQAVPGFCRVKPQGQLGDRKNDGFVKDRGWYWQVYAPEEPPARKQEALRKAIEDFSGLHEYWNEIATITRYHFALNDKYLGAGPDLHKALANIEATYDLELASLYLAKDLEEHFLGLSEGDMISLVGHIPSGKPLENLQFGVLEEVIIQLSSQPVQAFTGDTLTVPDWDDKITFNELTPQVARLLEVGSYQSRDLEDYFDRQSSTLERDVRDRLVALYQRTEEEITALPEATSRGDLVFFRMLRELGGDVRARQSAALVVMAFYFEACDVFKEPPE